jgi:thioredoxin-related protein
MKRMTAVLALVAGLFVAGAQAGEGWLTDFDKAKAQAKEQGRPILVDFSGSDWCGWCIKLDKEVFSQQEFKDFAKDNLVLLLLDFPRKKEMPAAEKAANEALSKTYKVRGFPTVLILDAEGQELGRTGYQPGGPKAYIEHLKGFLPKTSK